MTIRVNPPRALLPLDRFRPHDYSLIPVEQYYALKGKRQLDYISSQGCNFRCAFCSDPFVYGRKWVGLDPTSMVGKLRALWERYRFDDVNFQDETFFTKRERVRSMAQQIVDSDMQFTWAATMRADQGVRLPDDVWAALQTLRAAPPAGGRGVGRSAKCSSTSRRTWTSTRCSIPRTRCANSASPGTFPFIVGFPEETDDSVAKTIEVAKKLRSMSESFETPIFYFKPYPGSDIVTEAVARGFQLPDSLTDWSRFDFVAGLPGPWVSADKYKLIERFKFFLDLAGKRESMLRRLAQLRCRHNDYRFPIEMHVMRWLWPAQKLS